VPCIGESDCFITLADDLSCLVTGRVVPDVQDVGVKGVSHSSSINFVSSRFSRRNSSLWKSMRSSSERMIRSDTGLMYVNFLITSSLSEVHRPTSVPQAWRRYAVVCMCLTSEVRGV